MYKLQYINKYGAKGQYIDVFSYQVNAMAEYINIYWKYGNRQIQGTSYLNEYKSILIIDEDTGDIKYRYANTIKDEETINVITIEYSYISKASGLFSRDKKSFGRKEDALKFLYAMKGKIYNITWTCEDPSDNDYLWKKYRP